MTEPARYGVARYGIDRYAEPEPVVVPPFGGPLEIAFPEIRRAGVAVLRIVATGTWRLRMTDQELRRRVREYIADLVG